MSRRALAVALIIALSITPTTAADKYWDIDGVTAGAGGATPTGTWNTSAANWTTDSTGASAATTWTNGDAAFFSASNDATGTFVVTTGAAMVASAIFVEEGTVQLSATSTNTLTASGMTISSGATFSVLTALSFTPTAGSTLTLNGGTIQNRNTGTGSSFLTSGSANTNMKITLGTGGGHVSANGGAGIVTIYTGLINGTGPLYVDGNGVFRLTTTAATYTGDTIINGRLQISTTANVLPAATNLIINTGGVFDFQTSQTISSLSGSGNMIGSNSAAVLTINGSSSTNYDGVWSGTSNRINVNKSGGTLTLNGVNTGTGRFTVTAGNVDVASTGSIGGNVMDLHVDGGTLTFNQAAESVENLQGIGGSIILNNAALSLVIDPVGTSINSSAISGAGGLTKVNVISGATIRTQTLAGNNSYDGNTLVNGGILSVQHANALGSTVGYTEVNQVGAVAAELLFTTAAGGVTTAEPLRISGVGASNNGAIAVTAGATPTISGPVTLIGDSTITVSGTSSVLYNNANSFTSLANQNLTLQGGSGAAPLGIGTITGIIALGTGGLTKLQGGTWILSGANTYDGTTSISAGILNIQNASALGSTVGNTSVINAASLQLQGGIVTLAEALTLSSTATAGALRNISGTNDFTGLITLGASTRINSDADLLIISNGGTITGPTFNLTVGGAGNTAITSIIGTTTGGLTKDGTGTLFLNGVNTYAGNTTINDGVLSVGNVAAIPSGTGFGNVVLDGGALVAGTLDLAGLSAGINGLSGTANTVLGQVINSTVATTSVLTTGNGDAGGSFAGLIRDNTGTGGTVALTKVGLGTLILSGANTYTGATTISGGVLEITSLADGGNPSNIGQSSGVAANLVLDGGLLRYNGPDIFTDRLLTLTQNGGVLESSNASNGAVNFTNTNVVAFAGSGPRFLAFTGTSTGPNTFNPEIGDGSGGATTIIKGSGAGTWILLGKNTYTGDTEIHGGVLQANNDGINGTFIGASIKFMGGTLKAHSGAGINTSKAVTATATILLDTTNANITLNGNIAATSFGLTTNGGNTVTLGGTNSYAGTTTVNGGTLRINGDNSGSGGAVNLVADTGATLRGTGIVGGHVTVPGGSSPGTIRGGNSIGTLTLTSGLTVDAGGQVFVEIADGSTPSGTAGGSTVGLLPNPTSNNFLNITGGTTTFDSGTVILVNASAATFTIETPYSYQIASGAGNQSALNIAVDSQFVFDIPVQAGATSLTGNAGGAVFLNFIPLPEPGLIAVIGLAGLAALRRRHR